MSSDFISLLTQSSGAALVTGMFIWFLLKIAKWFQTYIKDTEKRFEKLQKDFSLVIVKHIKENTDAMRQFSEKLHEFNETLKENKHIMESIYRKNIELKNENQTKH